MPDQKVFSHSGPGTDDWIYLEEIDPTSSVPVQYAVFSTGEVARGDRSPGDSRKIAAPGRSFGQLLQQLWTYTLAVFLPAGYPHSVTEDYAQYVLISQSDLLLLSQALYCWQECFPFIISFEGYQIYDSLQAFCSSIAGLLASRAVLSSVGVGDSEASPTSALILSVLQESMGRVATILFAHRLGTSLEPECKAYRLAADFFNDAAMLLDCLSPALPRELRVVILSGSSALRALCGVAAGSAKASLSAHFAQRGNLGEVNAKDSSQETVISLVGMLAGTFVVSRVTSTWATWAAMLALIALHLIMNYLAVRAVRMTTLNRQRANIVLSSLFESSIAPNPTDVSMLERVFAMDGTLRYFALPPGTKGGGIGVTRGRKVGFVEVATSFSRLAAVLKQDKMSMSRLLQVFDREQFIVWDSLSTGRTYLVIKEGATPKDILKAWALALLWRKRRHLEGSKNTDIQEAVACLTTLSQAWELYIQQLSEKGWDLDVQSVETGKARRLRLRKEA